METCPHCGEPTALHSGPCKAELSLMVADQNIDLSRLSLEVAALRWQHTQDVLDHGEVRRFHA